jgi:hypothetical protein
MNFAKLGKLGAFLGSVAAVGGVIVAILGYIVKSDGDKKAAKIPIEISVANNNPVTKKTIAKAESLLGLWLGDPGEIFTEANPIWMTRKQTDLKNYYDPQVMEASVRFERAEQKDELIAHFTFVNESFDHHFRAIGKVTEKDIWPLKVTHEKQYGAEPNLKVSSGEFFITESGRLRVDFTITDYAEITFFANSDIAGE